VISFKCSYYETAVKEGSEEAAKKKMPQEKPEPLSEACVTPVQNRS
jgi:hypothetical protein